MDPRSVEGILDAIAKHWPIDSNAEITLEANPTSVEADRFRGYRAAGVNRVSLGVQSLRPEPLAELGRLHTVDEAIAAVRLAQSIFPRTSFDLIYARPQQTLEDWRDELLEGAVARAGPPLALPAHHRGGHALLRPRAGRKAQDAGRGPRRRFLRADAGADEGSGAAGLRDFQPRAAGAGVAAQPPLLALRRVCRRRPGRARPAADQQPPPRDGDREAAVRLAEARRLARPRHGHRRHADAGKKRATSCW